MNKMKGEMVLTLLVQFNGLKIGSQLREELLHGHAVGTKRLAASKITQIHVIIIIIIAIFSFS